MSVQGRYDQEVRNPSDRHTHDETADARAVHPHPYRLTFEIEGLTSHYKSPILLTRDQAREYATTYEDARIVRATLAHMLNHHRYNRQVQLARKKGGAKFGSNHLAQGLVASLEEPRITLRQIARGIPAIPPGSSHPLEIILRRVY